MVYAFFLTHWCACLWAALPSLLALPLFGDEANRREQQQQQQQQVGGGGDDGDGDGDGGGGDGGDDDDDGDDDNDDDDLRKNRCWVNKKKD